jgi:hypothetical protein
MSPIQLIRNNFQSLFKKAILGSLEPFFQLNHQVDMSFYLAETTTLCRSREVASWHHHDVLLVYVSINNPTNVGEKGHPCLAPMSYITLPCVSTFIQTFCVNCGLHGFLHHVVNEAVHLIVGGMLQSLSHAGLCQDHFWNQWNKNRGLDLQILIVLLMYVMEGRDPK